MEAVRNFETSVYSNENTRRYFQESRHLLTHRLENQKSHIASLLLRFSNIRILPSIFMWFALQYSCEVLSKSSLCKFIGIGA